MRRLAVTSTASDDLRGVEDDAHELALVDVDGHALQLVAAEAVERGQQIVGAARQRREVDVALAVGDGGLRRAGVGIGQRDRGAGHDRGALIEHEHAQRSGVHLRVARVRL